MEVHPPQHAIHSWRDFFIHLATIAIGLLIALSLEGCVEWAHHRHVLHAAREKLQVQLRENQETLSRDLQHFQQAEERLQRDVAILRHHEFEPKGPESGALEFGWSYDGFDDSALQTARDTGALALMSYEEVEGYSMTFSQQSYVNQASVAYVAQVNLAQSVLLRGHSQAELTPGETQELLAACSLAQTKLRFAASLMNSLSKSYDHLLKPH